MKRNEIIILSLCIYYIFFPQVGYVWNGDIIGKVLYSFSHANIFHLLGNCFVIWLFKSPIPIEALLIAIVCAFFPCFYSEPTMGASGVIFAFVGMCWASTGDFKLMCQRVLPLTIAIGLLPSVNMMIHIYCLFMGYFYYSLKRKRYA